MRLPALTDLSPRQKEISDRITARRGSLGNYSMLAMLLNAFQVDLQPVEPPYPDVRGCAKAVTR